VLAVFSRRTLCLIPFAGSVANRCERRVTDTKQGSRAVNVLSARANLLAAGLLVMASTNGWQPLPFLAGAFCASLGLAVIFSQPE